MGKKKDYYPSWLNFTNKREIFYPASIVISRKPGNFISDSICAFANEKGERGMASHVSITIDHRDIEIKQLRKIERKWRRKGYPIDNDTVWVAESTLPKSRIAPLDIYFTTAYETLIIDWYRLPKSLVSKARRVMSKRAIGQLGEIYPFWNLGLFALDKLTAWTGLGVGEIISKSPLRVCSRFVGYAVSTKAMCNRYGFMYNGFKTLLLKYNGHPGAVGIPISEATPDDFYDSAYQRPRMFERIISTYKIQE